MCCSVYTDLAINIVTHNDRIYNVVATNANSSAAIIVKSDYFLIYPPLCLIVLITL